MEVVQIRGEAKALDRAVNVLLDVRGGVGETTLAKDIKATLGSNYSC